MTTTVEFNSYVFDTNGAGHVGKTVADRADLKLEGGEFVIQSPTGNRTIGVLTGCTRMFWYHACPTIKRYEIDTVVIDGAVWGVKGAAISGTCAVRPERLINPVR